MKKHLPLLLAVCYCTAAHAIPVLKQRTPATAIEQQHQQVFNDIMKKQLSRNSALKTTAVQKRMVANSYTANNALLDSNHYYYSNGRGSVHNVFDSYTDAYFPLTVGATQNVFSDSSMHWMDLGRGLDFNDSKHYRYTAGTQVLGFTFKATDYLTQYAPAYNSLGKITFIVASDTFGGTGLIPKSNVYYEYDAQNNCIKDSTVSIAGGVTSARNIYTRDANGNMLSMETSNFYSGTWHQTSTTSYTYDANNRIVTRAYAFDMGSGVENVFRDSFAYTGTIPQFTFHASASWDALSTEWDDDTRIVYQLNAQNLPDTSIVFDTRISGNLDTMERNVFHYDANNLFLYSNAFRYVAGSFRTTPFDQTTIYYEDHFPTAIVNTNAPKDSTRIYPNPATNNLKIKSTLGNTISISNIAGQQLYRSTITSAEQTINIQQWQPGNYILSVYDASGITVSQQQFSKL